MVNHTTVRAIACMLCSVRACPSDVARGVFYSCTTYSSIKQLVVPLVYSTYYLSYGIALIEVYHFQPGVGFARSD